MNVSDLTLAELHSALSRDGIYLHTFPFVVHLQSEVTSLASGIHALYADYEVELDAEFSDFHMQIALPNSLRRWFKPKVTFIHDGETPFTPLPASQAYPLFEWALNWCVANHVRQYLTFHAAMLEKGGHAIILPGVPGAGKSTLCAALACRGWRLLTDEITMISTRDNMAIPVPRPVSLKNESIDVIQSFAPEAVIGERAHNTAKGTVANMKPSVESIKNARQCARPAWVVFPCYRQGAETQLEPISKCDAFMRLIQYSFNYHVTGVQGFQAVGKMLDDSECYTFCYSDLDEAIALFDGFQGAKSQTVAGGKA